MPRTSLRTRTQRAKSSTDKEKQTDMGFLKRLLGGTEESPEEQKQRTAERNFNTLRDDGVRAKNMGEIPYAAKCFTEALTIKDDLETRSYLAEAYLRMQDYGKALPQLAILTEAEPENLEIALLKAQTEGRTGNHEAMKATCEALLAAHPEEPRALYLMAEAAHGLHEEIEAIALLTRALQAQPAYTAARQLRARVLSEMGQYAEVLEDARALVEAESENEEFQLLLAGALTATGGNEEAENAYKTVLQLNPFNREAVLGLGQLYEQTARRDKALALYDESIELQPDFAEAYKQRGAVRLALNDKEGATDDLKRALELRPEAAADFNGEFSNLENRMAERYRSMNPYGF